MEDFTAMLIAVGLNIAIWRIAARDIPFLHWMLLVGGALSYTAALTHLGFRLQEAAPGGLFVGFCLGFVYGALKNVKQ